MSKVQANTRKKLRRRRMIAAKEAKAAAKAARYSQQDSRQAARTLAVFEGCDPERTLALLGEEF